MAIARRRTMEEEVQAVKRPRSQPSCRPPAKCLDPTFRNIEFSHGKKPLSHSAGSGRRAMRRDLARLVRSGETRPPGFAAVSIEGNHDEVPARRLGAHRSG